MTDGSLPDFRAFGEVGVRGNLFYKGEEKR